MVQYSSVPSDAGPYGTVLCEDIVGDDSVRTDVLVRQTGFEQRRTAVPHEPFPDRRHDLKAASEDEPKDGVQLAGRPGYAVCYALADLRGRRLESKSAELLSHGLFANVAWLIARYLASESDLPWLDNRTRKVLNPAREWKDVPAADRSPRYCDGYTEEPEAT